MALEGPLSKWTNVVSGWQYRWVRLDRHQGLLSYYTSREKMMKGDRRGCLRLRNAVIHVDDDTFMITSDGKHFYFQAHGSSERLRWVNLISDAIAYHSGQSRSKDSRSSNLERATIGDFERKLVETDTYLQLLICQLKSLDAKIEAVFSENDKQNLIDIKAKLFTFLDSIKHSIIHLQIAKNTISPVNGISAAFQISDLNNDTESNVSNDESKSLASSATLSNSEIEANEIVCVDQRPKSEQRDSNDVSVALVQRAASYVEDLSLNSVPQVSYSSDDDDGDFFFDAEDESEIQYHQTSKTIRSTAGDKLTYSEEMGRRKLIKPSSPPSLSSIAGSSGMPIHSNSEEFDPNINYDQFYEEEGDEDVGSISKHGSVISHLISQVRVGMDLTKVTLPTFILERRSLLEMYADFFAHPDLFVCIPDYQTPEERFIQTVRWYLSAFHAGRKNSTAKKPFNPVLGEIFRCHWDLSDFSKAPQSSKDTTTEGPVPWSTSNDLSFVAEQVSHHPPISAFYAEHVGKRIMCSAQIYTKSKFLGLSVCVYNIGQGTVYLLDHGEEYVITFPSAYGRSILNVPWIELGGQVTVNCPQTGYSAKIDFLCKPMIGGKKHQIYGEILNPDKKTIMTINGEWNGVMEAKNNGASRVFVDTKSMKPIKKKVRPVRDQEPFESRRLWKDVAVSLKLQDITKATNAKCTLEQTQRDLVKQREQSGTNWANRVFHRTGDSWFFNKPLSKRISSNENLSPLSTPNSQSSSTKNVH